MPPCGGCPCASAQRRRAHDERHGRSAGGRREPAATHAAECRSECCGTHASWRGGQRRGDGEWASRRSPHPRRRRRHSRTGSQTDLRSVRAARCGSSQCRRRSGAPDRAMDCRSAWGPPGTRGERFDGQYVSDRAASRVGVQLTATGVMSTLTGCRRTDQKAQASRRTIDSRYHPWPNSHETRGLSFPSRRDSRTMLPRSFRLVAAGEIMHVKLWSAAVLLSGSVVLAQGTPSRQVEWPYVGGDQANSKFSPLTEINPDNVKGLAVAWKWNHGEGPRE